MCLLGLWSPVFLTTCLRVCLSSPVDPEIGRKQVEAFCKHLHIVTYLDLQTLIRRIGS